MIVIKKLGLQRGQKVLLQDASVTVFPGQRIGLIGHNGCGKSSLFSLLRGELHPDQGDVSIPAGWVVAHVAQDTPALDCSALDYALDGDRELRQVEAELAAAESRHDGEGIGHCHDLLRAIDGYTAKARASALLHGLGFTDAQLDAPVKSFSGGWRMRLNLAQALMCRSDLLLLDEPTNHLDLETVIWLENWLQRYPGTLLLISHDRDVLDNVVQGILHLDQQQLMLYSGNYAAFERQRSERLAQQQALYEQQQRQVAHLQSYIDRFRAKATKARQAQSRIKALERMEQVAAVHVESPFQFEFLEPVSQPQQLLKLEQVDAGYGDKTILRKVDLQVLDGMRIGLIGVNGAGKSTLVKLLAGVMPPLAGQRLEGKGLQIGYFAQQQLEQLDPDASPLLHLQRLDPQGREQEFRNFLGGFMFHGDMATGPVRPFSGGEKTRLALALLIWQRPNLLLLDEPTNHLDLEMRDALTLALQAYQGALIVVSHDRYLLKTTTDQFWLVGHGRVQHYEGDLDDYRDFLQQQQPQVVNDSAVDATPSVDRKAQKRAEAEQRQALAKLRKPLENKLARLEPELAAQQAELAQVEARLNDSSLYEAEQKAALQQCLQTQVKLKASLAELEERWLSLQMELEAINESVL
ncbi:ATP-binding cassette domain-containing protein [Leeia aquatica]|uniref:Probable ATP-binding protein YheS n=1 Tax=Leeia aquatica TaxID=2725557 RepID=A0A847S953_9NEIS|nr:ATP-binding cassette domain-containing protein [Leeia aquatica]NLR75385.1 ATP-binding cassette domain-containing protein [Leeia aquatica]